MAEADGIEVSVVVCTRNRAGPLGQMLESMAAMNVPPGLAWELVVVDNGSSDGTADVAARFVSRLPIQYTREERPGLSNARNCGVRVARGRYLCWTDDDTMVDRGWLAGYVAAFRAHPEAAVFGGAIHPDLQGPTPAWFAALVERWPLNHIVARRDFGDQPLPLDPARDVLPWGANYAIRAAEQRAVAYDPNLGVSPLHRRSSEESQLIFEILNSGASGWWAPDCKVLHLFPPHRQTRRYVLEHFAAIGEAQAYLDDTRKVHIMNQDGMQPRLVRSSPVSLRLRVAFNAVLSTAFWAAGLKLRSLYHLRRRGLYAGVLAYKASTGGGAASASLATGLA
jgi:glycosyltransferase involved in cell wall biosynthesis